MRGDIRSCPLDCCVAVAVLDREGVVKYINYNRQVALNPGRLDSVGGEFFSALPWYGPESTDVISNAINSVSCGECDRSEITIEAHDIETGARHTRRMVFTRRGDTVMVKIYGADTRSGKLWKFGGGVKKLIVATMAIIAVGCATAGDLARTEPTRTERRTGRYDRMATCLVDRIDAHGSLGNPYLRVNTADQVARVFRTLEPSEAAVYEFRFTQESDMVLIESRGMMTIGGRAIHPDYVWPLLDGCQ